MNKQSKKIDTNPFIANLNEWPASIVPPIGDYFSTQDVKKILRGINLSKRIDAIGDESKLSEITNKLNTAAIGYFVIKNLENKPTVKKINNEIKKLVRACDNFYLLLAILNDLSKLT